MEKANPEQVADDHDCPPYKLLLICPSGLSSSQVSVVFDEAYDRIPHPEIDAENSISEYTFVETPMYHQVNFLPLDKEAFAIWKYEKRHIHLRIAYMDLYRLNKLKRYGVHAFFQSDTCECGFFEQLFQWIHPRKQIWDLRLQQNASLFNGKKFRYGGQACNSGADCNQLHHICLHLGLTDYRTFVGTNLNPMWKKFLVPSEDDYQLCQHTSSPLGNGAVVETSDKKILVLQRSHNVGEFPGHFVFPGGHPEPEEVGIVSHQQEKDLNSAELINNKISQEMFDSIIREVVEEIGVPTPTLCNPAFIGISRRVLNVRPAAFFFIKCSLQSEEIQQLYSSAKDVYESTQLYTVSLNDLEIMAPKMPGCHQGGFALYKLMVEAAKDTQQ